MSDRWAWTYTSDGSDVSPPSGIGRMMRRYYYTPTTEVVNVDPEGTPSDVFYYSPANQPNSLRWESLFPDQPGGDDTHIFLDVAASEAGMKLSVLAQRVDGFGVVLQTLGQLTNQDVSAPGLKEYRFTHAAQTNPSRADRIRLRLRFTNASLNPTQITYGIGDPLVDVYRSTVLMANPEIAWSTSVIAFPGPLTEWDARPRADRVLDFSGGGVSATSLRHLFWQMRAGLRRFEDKDFQAALVAWWSWAGRGKQYAFALDSAEKVDRVLSGAAAAGQAVIPMSDTSGISVGKKYLLRELIGEEFEIVQVASISAGVSVTANANLKYGYLTGDIFRSRDYFPKVVSLDDVFPVTEETTVFSLDHQAREDFG